MSFSQFSDRSSFVDSAISRAFGGKLLVYSRKESGCDLEHNHVIEVSNGVISREYTTYWDGKGYAVGKIPPGASVVGACAWGMGLKKLGFNIVRRASLKEVE